MGVGTCLIRVCCRRTKVHVRYLIWWVLVITANMQSETGFPSRPSHQLKSYVASKSRLKLAARAVLSADAGLLVTSTRGTPVSVDECWRYDCTDMNIYRSALCACVVRGLPNIYEYINKDRNKAEEKKKRTWMWACHGTVNGLHLSTDHFVAFCRLLI